jgi:hypothetical protein
MLRPATSPHLTPHLKAHRALISVISRSLYFQLARDPSEVNRLRTEILAQLESNEKISVRLIRGRG